MSLAPISIHDLGSALGLGSSEVVSLVGGGGKTTALFALGRQLSGRVVLSTTTKMGSDRAGGRAPLVGPTDQELSAALDRDRVVLAWRAIDDHRAEGFPAERVDDWHELADHIVVEADGSRRRPYKAPGPHEPVVPASTSVLVACVGAAAFDAPISTACHRPEIAADLVGRGVDDMLDPIVMARLLLHPHGSRKGRPPTARFVILLNQVTEAHQPFVDSLASALDGAAPVVTVAPFGPGDSPEG